jgi:hypothetical protein
MKARGPLLVLVCALLLPPAGALANPGYEVKPQGLHLGLSLPASNGYSAALIPAEDQHVTLRISKGAFSAKYTAPGRVSSKRIEADFGEFGHVSLRFTPESRFTPEGPLAGLPVPPSLRERCVGKQAVGERGEFEGSVNFAAERGFTEIATRRVKGTIVRTYKRVCKRSGGFFPNSEQEGVFYLAQARRDGVLRFLFGIEISISLGNEEIAATVAAGGERRKVGPVVLRKQLLTFEENSSIDASPAGKQPETAEVRLQRPFEGTASYLREANAPATWTGDLSATLPGSGLVPLAGPEFDAEICRSPSEGGFDHCVASLDSPFAQGSSSSLSQPLALAGSLAGR